MKMAFSKTHFQQYKVIYEALALFAYFAINAGINATSVLMEEAREAQASFQNWEPFVWEYSSAFASLIIIPLIAWLTRRYPWNWRANKRSLLLYSSAALAYSLLHVLLMVAARELVYLPTASDYQFASDLQTLIFEMFYELHKDIWSFCFFVVMIAVYRYLISQYLGDVTSLSEHGARDGDEFAANDTHTYDINTENTALANILLVKKLGKEFLVKTDQIEWIEACGNYANLHIGNDVYPMRITMAGFVKKGSDFGFVRVHKSFAVNINSIRFIEALASGDAEIVMLSGKKVRLSRRYKTDFDASIIKA